MSKVRNIFSVILAVLALLASAPLSLAYFSLWNLNDYLFSIKEYLKDPEAEWIIFFTAIGMLATLILSLTAYLMTLDYKRDKRPRILLYACLLGMSLQVSSFVGANLENYLTLPFIIPLCVMIAFGAPLLIFPVESFFRTVFSGLGRMAFSWKWNGIAAKFFHKALLFKPQNKNLLEFFGQALHKGGKISPSRSVLLPLLQSPGLSVTSLRLLAEGFDAEGDWKRAAEIYHKILVLKPLNKEISEILIAIYVNNEQFDKAIQILEPLVDYDSLKDVFRLEDLYAKVFRMDRVRDLLLKAAEIEKSPCSATLLEYRRLLKTHPIDKAFLQDVADLCWTLDRKSEAADYYEEILLVEPDNKPLRRKILDFYFDSSQPERVDRHIEYLISQGELSPIILQEYAELLMRKEDFNGARQYLEKARELYPDEFQFPYIMAQLFYNEKHYDNARQEMALALRLVPPDKKEQIQILFRKIEGAILNAQIKKLRSEVERNPDNVEMRFSLIDQLMANAYLERVTHEIDTLLYYHPELKSNVIEHIEELVNKHERNFLLLDYLADMRLREGNYDKCMEIYEKMYSQSLDPKEVIRNCCGKILSMNPNYLPARKKLGDLARDEKNWELMIEYYEFCRNNDEDFIADRLENLFDGFNETGDLEKAALIGLKLIDKEPENPLYFSKLGRLYIDMNRFQDAVNILDKALKLDPENREFKNLFLKAVDSRQNQELDDILKRLDAEPDNSEYREYAGDLLCYFDKFTDAVIHYQRAAQLAPEADLPKAKLAFALAKMGMMDLAEETLDEIKLHLDNSSAQESLKRYFYDTARQFDKELEPQKALKFFKQIFRIDAAYNDVVERIEKIENRGFVISPYGKKIKTGKTAASDKS